MSRLDEPVDRASVTYSARLTADAHDHGRRCCVDCPGEGCAQDAWALETLGLATRTAPLDDRPHGVAGDQKETPVQQLTFVRPERCDNSGPNCVEVAIDVDGSRVVRNSQQPETQIRFSQREWTAFVDSVRAGQPL
ncbi:DUF397 domain-containing protein [Micromonospora sp. NPDC051006]|uniref:DUF397 domain-containing protein n=1 Tax=Micromonospora sp. NPDC051006 TaxID=3364283 RepID=UPI00378AEE00